VSCEEVDIEAALLVERIRAARLNPLYFERLINARGAIKGFRILMESGVAQSGFISLMEKNLSELSAEAFVLEPRWADCFDETVKKAARFRLDHWKELPRE